MPYREQWVAPKLFLEHKGVRVFHSYKHDDIENGTRNFSFTLDPLGSGYKDSFDVRELRTWQQPPQPPHVIGPNADTTANRTAGDPNAIRQAIIAAIDAGILKKREEVDYGETRYCENPLCDTEAMHTVQVSVNSPSDAKRHYCECCYQAYLVGVQHGTYRPAQERLP